MDSIRCHFYYIVVASSYVSLANCSLLCNWTLVTVRTALPVYCAAKSPRNRRSGLRRTHCSTRWCSCCMAWHDWRPEERQRGSRKRSSLICLVRLMDVLRSRKERRLLYTHRSCLSLRLDRRKRVINAPRNQLWPLIAHGLYVIYTRLSRWVVVCDSVIASKYHLLDPQRMQVRQNAASAFDPSAKQVRDDWATRMLSN